MAEEKIKVSIRSALAPVFYRDFRCLAQDCRDSCCENWKVTFDKKDYLRLRRLDAPPALRKRLEQGIRRVKKEDRSDEAYGKFDLESNNGRCPFLDENKLCAIQCACGHDALPRVCTTFPRVIGYTAAAKEYVLSLSCEGVLQRLWDLPGGVEFVEDPLPKTERRDMELPGTGKFLRYFAPVREVFIDILQNRAMPLTERMLCLGIMIRRLQEENWGEFDLDGWMEQTALLAGSDAVMEMDIPGNQVMYVVQNLSVLRTVTLLGRSWPADIYKALKVEWSLDPDDGEDGPGGIFSPKAYLDALAQFKTAFSDREYFFENLMVMAALCLRFPDLSSKEALWKSYISLCSLYSLFRFVSVAGCKDEPTKERLFHMIVMASRATMHNRNLSKWLREKLLKHESSTLAHMAILLRWD